MFLKLQQVLYGLIGTISGKASMRRAHASFFVLERKFDFDAIGRPWEQEASTLGAEPTHVVAHEHVDCWKKTGRFLQFEICFGQRESFVALVRKLAIVDVVYRHAVSVDEDCVDRNQFVVVSVVESADAYRVVVVFLAVHLELVECEHVVSIYI